MSTLLWPTHLLNWILCSFMRVWKALLRNAGADMKSENTKNVRTWSWWLVSLWFLVWVVEFIFRESNSDRKCVLVPQMCFMLFIYLLITCFYLPIYYMLFIYLFFLHDQWSLGNRKQFVLNCRWLFFLQQNDHCILYREINLSSKCRERFLFVCIVKGNLWTNTQFPEVAYF